MYSHIVLRVRGDGRSYMLNIATMGYYDIMWNDVYSYALFTRGGPYWQLSKVKHRRQDDKSKLSGNFSALRFIKVSEYQNSVDGCISDLSMHVIYFGCRRKPMFQAFAFLWHY